VIARVIAAGFTLAHALILRTYPKRFRHRFGQPMSLAMRDSLAAAARSGGVRAIVISGTRALQDALAGAPAEHAVDARDRLLWPTPARSLPGSHRMFADSLLGDGRFAVSSLRRTPLFATLTIVALALGLGANSAIFAVVRGVLLRPLPYAEPDRLVMIWSDNSRENKPRNPVSPANFADLRSGTRSFERMEALFSFLIPQRIDAGNGVELAHAAIVTPGMFDLLGRKPALGRTFSSSDTRGVIVLSHGYWQRRFGGDRKIVGRWFLSSIRLRQ
jgi:hypothetical protein